MKDHVWVKKRLPRMGQKEAVTWQPLFDQIIFNPPCNSQDSNSLPQETSQTPLPLKF
jgi:hypothetical protein